MQVAHAAGTETAGNIAGGTATELANLLQMFIAKIPLFIAAALVIFLAFLAAKIARSIVENKLAESGIEEEHKEVQILGGRMTYSGILVLGITVGLKIAGIDLTTILAAVAFGIGFALKDLIMNFLAGIMILVGRHFTIGDFIKVGSTIGKVVEIQSRTTVLQAIDGTKVIVPNADLFKKQVVSFTSNPFRRIELIVGVDYRTNLENALKICMDTMKHTEGILAEPKPAVLVDDFAESSINLKLRAWVDSRGGWVKVKSDLVKNIKTRFDQYGIVIPWPIRTLSYDKDQKYSEKKFVEQNLGSAEIPLKPNQAAQPKSAVQTTFTAVSPVKVATETVPVQVDDEQPLKPLNEQM